MKNLTKLFSTVLVGGTMALGATQASAALVTTTIDFTGNAGLQAGSTMTFNNGSISVDAIAGATAQNGEYNIVSRIGQYSPGLGNSSSYSYDYTKRELRCCFYYTNVTKTKNVNDDSHEVDNWDDNGHGVNEFIKLDFGYDLVTLVGAKFGANGTNDDATVSVLGANQDELYAGNAKTLDSGDIAANSSTMFWFSTLLNGYNNDDWKLKSVTVQYDDGGPGGNEVPEPGTLALLGAGLLGLGMARRRKTA